MQSFRMLGRLFLSLVLFAYAVAYAEEPKPPEPQKTNWKLCALHLKIGTVMKGLVLDQPGMAIQYDNGGPILPFDRNQITKIEPLPEDEAKAVLADIAKRRKWTEAKRQQAWEDAAPEREAREAEYQEVKRKKLLAALHKHKNDIENFLLKAQTVRQQQEMEFEAAVKRKDIKAAELIASNNAKLAAHCASLVADYKKTWSLIQKLEGVLTAIVLPESNDDPNDKQRLLVELYRLKKKCEDSSDDTKDEISRCKRYIDEAIEKMDLEAAERFREAIVQLKKNLDDQNVIYAEIQEQIHYLEKKP